MDGALVVVVLDVDVHEVEEDHGVSSVLLMKSHHHSLNCEELELCAEGVEFLLEDLAWGSTCCCACTCGST